MKHLEDNILATISGGDRACRQARRALKDAAESGADQITIDQLVLEWMDACDVI